MTPPQKKSSRGNVPKPSSYTVAGHPIGASAAPEPIRDHLHTLGVGDTIDITISSADAKALKDQGVIA